MRLSLALHRVLCGIGWLLIGYSQFSCKDESIPAGTPAFTYAYVTNLGNHTVSVIDLHSFKNIKTIQVGKSPDRIVASPVADLLLAADLESSSISVIDSKNQVVKKNLTVGKNPTDIIFTPDGRFAYVACYSSNTISVIDCQALNVV